MNPKKLTISCILICFFASSVFAQKEFRVTIGGTLMSKTIVSKVLRGTITNLDSNRTVKVYLPPGYSESKKSYPVVYFLHSIFTNAEKVLADGKVLRLMETGFTNNIVNEFILVVADFSSPTVGSLYENSPATGRWTDFTVQELVPFIDRNFRTLSQSASRALVGEMMGGRGAFMLGMQYPHLFGIVYAMNPVGTGTGLLPIEHYPNWRKMHGAKSLADLHDEPISQIFVAISQAFLPNPDRPPFYCNFVMEMEKDQPVYHAGHAQELIRGFLVHHQLDKYGKNLKQLKALGFDWSRYDPIQDHVYGSEALSRKLDSFGVEHEAEEYRGVYWNENWKDHGRFYSRVLPFLSRNLLFDKINLE